MEASQNNARWWSLVTLIIAGESIFFLPFVLTRIFRVTYLQVLEIDNSQLGACFAVYGTVALLSYFVGGPLADKFEPRWLMSIALCSTGASGFLLAQFPSFNGLMLLYGFWGISTILLFWAPLIRSTREAGGGGGANMAFGILDGGRGLSAALIAVSAVSLLGWFLPENVADISDAERAQAFGQVVRYFSCFVIAAGVVVFLTMKRHVRSEEDALRFKPKDLGKVMRMPQVWLQALIIVCAYSAYRITDGFPQLAQDYLGLDELQAAGYASQALWLRPLGAVAGGVLATMFSTSRMCQWMFGLMATGGVLLGFGFVEQGVWVSFGGTLVCTCVGLYAMRGLYYAILEEGKIPLAVTGTAVGLVSIIGYLPDIYMARIMGYFYDNYPGVLGHQYSFMLLAVFAGIGILAVWRFRATVAKLQPV